MALASIAVQMGQKDGLQRLASHINLKSAALGLGRQGHGPPVFFPIPLHFLATAVASLPPRYPTFLYLFSHNLELARNNRDHGSFRQALHLPRESCRDGWMTAEPGVSFLPTPPHKLTVSCRTTLAPLPSSLSPRQTSSTSTLSTPSQPRVSLTTTAESTSLERCQLSRALMATS